MKGLPPLPNLPGLPPLPTGIPGMPTPVMPPIMPPPGAVHLGKRANPVENAIPGETEVDKKIKDSPQ
jgi:hypothetical protein